jgi:hypothetical protein
MNPKNRGLVNRQTFANAMDKELHRLFVQLHNETKIPQSKLLDEAIELLLIKRGKLPMEDDNNG